MEERDPMNESTGGALRTFLFVIVGLVAIGLAVCVGGWFALDAALNADGPAEQDTVVALAPGSSVSAIGEQLEAQGVLGSALAFKVVMTTRVRFRRFPRSPYHFL